jgi:hypothetical protein
MLDLVTGHSVAFALGVIVGALGKVGVSWVVDHVKRRS